MTFFKLQLNEGHRVRNEIRSNIKMILKKKHLNLRSEAVVYLPCFTFDFKENSKEMAAD